MTNQLQCGGGLHSVQVGCNNNMIQLSSTHFFNLLSTAQLPKSTPWRTTMGIKGLTKLLCQHAPRAITQHKLEDYSGCKIAIDASLIIYQSLIVVGRNGTTLLTNQAGEVTSHLQGMFAQSIRLIEAGVQPVYVFDGQPPSLKDGVLADREAAREDAAMDLAMAVQGCNSSEIEKFSKRTVKVTKRHVEDCCKLLHLMGIPTVQAPSEAEAECAALCKSGKVYAVASEDMDLLPFGAPRFLRQLMEPLSRKLPVLEFSLAKVLDELGITMDQLVDLCIFCGCDYISNIRGIGPQKALKLIRQYGNIETALINLNTERYKIPDIWPFHQVRDLFKFPEVTSAECQPDFQLIPPSEEELKVFLVEEKSFNSSRVIKAIEKLKAADKRYSTLMTFL